MRFRTSMTRAAVAGALAVTSAALVSALSGPAMAAQAEGTFPWNEPQAKVLPNGDLEWAPRPFEFVAGETVRYIDYENGNDGHPGTREQPWQRHPWDHKAGGQAVKHEGPTTYVFKRGVTYRGGLDVDESGTPEEPIRLTSDPSWGEGEARFYGSQQVTQWQRGAHEDMPGGQDIWYADVNATPRHVWMVDADGTVTPLKLARTPNWDEDADPRSPQSQWFAWENPRWWEQDPVRITIGDRKMHLGIDTKNLTEDPEYYEDALIWTQWGNMMGMPYATEVVEFDPERKAIAYEGPWHRDSGIIRTGHKYYLEDSPHYLDEAGEFWFDKQGNKGRLYVRLPGDANPNDTTIEVGDVINFIDGENYSHVHVSGLTFRFGDVAYDIAGRFFEHPDIESGVVRMQGSGQDIQVRNNTFEHVSNAVQVKVGPEDEFHTLIVADNDIQFTDHHGVNFACNTYSGHNIQVLRNRLHETGRRGIRPKDNFSINLGRLQTAHVAGNVLTRSHAAGVNVSAGKPGGNAAAGHQAPIVRILIHHNKVDESLLSANDWGGIETWQSGPFYVYNNLSKDPIGPFNNATFGFAYYMDGSFKNYLFNNIAWGTDNDPDSDLPNYAAFQAIHSYQNTLFNNTAYGFRFGSRRQAPQAGRDKYLGNLFQDISEEVFRHTDSNNEDPNARDAGEQKDDFAYATNAYAFNVLYDIQNIVGSFHAQGGKYTDFDAFVADLQEVNPLAGSVGTLTDVPPLRDPANGDFRPSSDSAAIDHGVRVFVPWSLYAVVGEWNFTPRQDDPSLITDEHFFLTTYHVSRNNYYERPMYPLQGQNITADDFVEGPLENWTNGALRLDGQDQFLSVSHDHISEPYRYGVGDEDHVAGPEELQSPDIHESNFLIEAYVKIDEGQQGLLVGKVDGNAGYQLSVIGSGQLQLGLFQDGNPVAARRSAGSIADGQWHHVIAEVERGAAEGLRIYVDGQLANGEGAGSAPEGSLSNTGDLLIGGGPGFDHLACTIDFLRIARGTLEEARTTIEELHTWQFAGPQYRDFNGRDPIGDRRDAGAIEAQ